MAPRGHEKGQPVSSLLPLLLQLLFPSAPLWSRRTEGIKTSARARFIIAHWFQRSSRVPTLLLMLWQGGWEWAGPSDSFELANLTPPPPTPTPTHGLSRNYHAQ